MRQMGVGDCEVALKRLRLLQQLPFASVAPQLHVVYVAGGHRGIDVQLQFVQPFSHHPVLSMHSECVRQRHQLSPKSLLSYGVVKVVPFRP